VFRHRLFLVSITDTTHDSRQRKLARPYSRIDMSWDDRDALLRAAATDRRHAALFAMLAKAGLRPGEGFALKPTDVDFKNLTVRVERSATDDGAVKDTKTHETRTVDLTPDLAAALKRHVTWLRAEALRAGTGEPEWLFPRADRALMDKNHAAAIFRRLLKHAGLPHYRVYDLRHTFASLLLAEGAPITYVAAQTRPLQPGDDAPVLREVDPEQGEALGQQPRPQAQPRRPRNQKVEPARRGRRKCLRRMAPLG
jgi:integrase